MEMRIMKYDEYKTHPRILELRVTAYYNMLVQEYGVNRTSNFLKTFCEMTYVDFQKINGIVNQYVKIRHLEKLNKTRYRQELVFMGHVYGETKYFISKKLLNITVGYLYKKGLNLLVEDFVNTEWLAILDNNVVICGIPQYALEAKRFVDAFEHFKEVLGNVSTPKT